MHVYLFTISGTSYLNIKIIKLIVILATKFYDINLSNWYICICITVCIDNDFGNKYNSWSNHQ